MSKPDLVETLPCGSIIHHGSFSDRIYLMKAAPKAKDLPERLKAMAQEKGYSKIFAKISEVDLSSFVHSSFEVEAYVPGFYRQKKSAFFVSYFCNDQRRFESKAGHQDTIRSLAISKALDPVKKLNTLKYTVRPAVEKDIERMVDVYTIVFASYPFPIHDPAYIQETMNSNVDYYCIESLDDGKIVSLASAEKDVSAGNAEMTDFATLPSFRGKGFANILLTVMEEESRKKGIKTFYTIARAESAGMNITFSKAGYLYGGRLKNNTNIAGAIESMNIWYKIPRVSH